MVKYYHSHHKITMDLKAPQPKIPKLKLVILMN